MTNEIELHVPGYIEDNNVTDTTVSTISQSKKRFVSASNEDKKNLKKNVIEYEC